MSTPAIPPLSLLNTASAAPSKDREPARIRDAAQQFEALLIGQMLRGVRESGSGWLGSGEDSTSECATDFAEQQFAAVLAQNGGLGIANLIARGLGISAADLQVCDRSKILPSAITAQP